jgi:methylglyoxal synthase
VTAKTLALIAHDGKKAAMTAFAKAHRQTFEKFRLVATKTTGALLTEEGFQVRSVLSGPQGGDAQIAAMVATGECHAVIFLRDPLGMHPHEPDISSLLRICEVHDVPLATNVATAELVIAGLEAKSGVVEGDRL